MSDVRINASDAMELGQLLDFLTGWFARTDDRLAAAYTDFVGHADADLTELRTSLARFAFLLGEDDDGQRLFGENT
jgi:hypothetical protein